MVTRPVWSATDVTRQGCKHNLRVQYLNVLCDIMLRRFPWQAGGSVV